MASRAICMIAYANYYTDARIKNYVDALVKNGFEVDVFALGSSEEEHPPGVRVYSLSEKHAGGGVAGLVLAQASFFARVTFLVGRHHLRRRYRLVHVHNMPDAIVFCGLVPKLAGAGLILDVHDTMPEAYVRIDRRVRKRQLANKGRGSYRA